MFDIAQRALPGAEQMEPHDFGLKLQNCELNQPLFLIPALVFCDRSRKWFSKLLEQLLILRETHLLDFYKGMVARCQWLTSIFLATQEMEIRRK
jgi:hypothetical protein